MLGLPVLFLAFFTRTYGKNSLPTDPFPSCGVSSIFKASSWMLPTPGGGKARATSETLPWQVSIQAEGKHICAGAILSSWWILSSAHCFTENDSSEDLEAVAHIEGDPSGRRPLERVIIHQDFNGETLQHDIALILLDAPIPFDDETTPICLPLLDDLSIWHNCWVATWRPITSEPGADENKTTKVLRRTEMTLIGREACSEKIKDLSWEVLCTVSEEEEEPKTCKDDSGSPLVCTHGENVKWFVIGIASKGENCGHEDIPAVYTTVFDYMDWIERSTATEGKPFIPEGVDDIGIRAEASVPDSTDPSFSAASMVAPIWAMMLFFL